VTAQREESRGKSEEGLWPTFEAEMGRRRGERGYCEFNDSPVKRGEEEEQGSWVPADSETQRESAGA
jgi:hypothetical protein